MQVKIIFRIITVNFQCPQIFEVFETFYCSRIESRSEYSDILQVRKTFCKFLDDFRCKITLPTFQLGYVFQVGSFRFFPFLCKLVGEFLNVNSGYNIKSLKITIQNETIYFHFYIWVNKHYDAHLKIKWFVFHKLKWPF